MRSKRFETILLLAVISGSAQTLSACTQPQNTSSPSVKPPDTVKDDSGSHQATPEVVAESWVEAVAMQRWQDAAAAFDATYPEPTKAEHRYVRARIALQLDDHERGLALLTDLEKPLSDFQSEIERLRAEAAFEVGPFETAGDFYAQKGVRLKAAQAYVRAKKPDLALQQIAAAERRPKDETDASLSQLRRIKAEILAERGKKADALKLYRDLALRWPTQPGADGADNAYEQLSGTRLNKKERYQRAESFTSDGNFEASQRELELMDSAGGPAPNGTEVLRTQAWSYYKSRKDYKKASELFTQTAKLDRKHRTQDLFFAARALSRAHQDELAIERYLDLARQNPSSHYAEQARYLAARLYFILGRLREAALAYNDYERRYKNGRYRHAVQHDRALSRLALGEHKAALKDLDAVLRRTKDDRERATLNELKAVALLGAEQHDQAKALFRQVIADFPLSLAAALSAARLEQLGEPETPLMPGEHSQKKPSALTIVWPHKAKTLTRLGLHHDAAEELYSERRAFIAAHAPRGEQALCEALGTLSTAQLRYSYAHRVVPERVLMRPISETTRWQWDCIYPRPYAPLVAEQERQRLVPNGLVHAIMRQESAFRSSVASPVGAVGLMQLMPATAEQAAQELNLEHHPSLLTSPPHNLTLGTFYIAKMLETFQGNVALAAAAYNAGPSAVRRWLTAGSNLPLDLWVAKIPYDETRGYVDRVVSNWLRYNYVSDGLPGVPRLGLTLPSVEPSAKEEY